MIVYHQFLLGYLTVISLASGVSTVLTCSDNISKTILIIFDLFFDLFIQLSEVVLNRWENVIKHLFVSLKYIYILKTFLGCLGITIIEKI